MDGIEAEFLRDPFAHHLDDPIGSGGCIFGREEEEVAALLGEFGNLPWLIR